MAISTALAIAADRRRQTHCAVKSLRRKQNHDVTRYYGIWRRQGLEHGIPATDREHQFNLNQVAENSAIRKLVGSIMIDDGRSDKLMEFVFRIANTRSRPVAEPMSQAGMNPRSLQTTRPMTSRAEQNLISTFQTRKQWINGPTATRCDGCRTDSTSSRSPTRPPISGPAADDFAARAANQWTENKQPAREPANGDASSPPNRPESG